MQNTFVLAIVIITALFFDLTNGFHDTANAVAPTIATGALKPRTAVGLSAILNLVGAFLSLKVAATIASSIVSAGSVTLTVIFAGLVGAIVWNVTTWYFNLPSSSSHALIGGVIGAMLAHAGSQAVDWHGVVSKVVVPGIAAPVIALVVAAIATMLAHRMTAKVDVGSRSLGMRVGQIGSSSLLSIAHGTNDAQKTMGIITLALIANGSISATASTPTWVIVACGTAIGLGTYLGGWRIIRTLGKGFTTLSPTQGFSAQMASSAVILTSSHFGLPLSTTYVATGSVVGTGVSTPPHKVRWALAGRVGAGWLTTLPCAGLVGALAYYGQSVFSESVGVVIIGVVAALFCAGVYVASRRHPVNPSNVNDPWEDPVPLDALQNTDV